MSTWHPACVNLHKNPCSSEASLYHSRYTVSGIKTSSIFCISMIVVQVKFQLQDKNKSKFSFINQIEPESQRGEIWFSLSTLMFIYKPKSNMTKITTKGIFADDLLHKVIGLDRYIKKDRAQICYTGSCTYIFQRCLGLTSYNRWPYMNFHCNPLLV